MLKISWQKLEDAKYYRYQLASDDKFNQLIVDRSTEDTSIEINDLKPGRYYLLVRGVDQYQLEGLDTVSEFEINQAPAEKDNSWIVPVSVGVLILIL